MIDFKWLSNLPSQQEIMEQWDGSYKGQPQVSIVCITYNQKDYIKDALNGFLQQKTKFPFEIIVHDDVSTDSTREILKSYRDKYPEIIKLILQKENQFSKSMYLPLKNCFDLAASSSKYIALCEGDDFWVVSNKLQEQYSALEYYKNIDICFTGAYRLFNSDKIEMNNELGSESNIFSLSETVRGGGGFMPTASIVIRKCVVNKIPEWLFTAPVVDFYLQVIASNPNGALCLPIKSCVYRVSSEGSWTQSRINMSKEKILDEHERSFYILNKLVGLGVNNEDIIRVMAGSSYMTSFNLMMNGYYRESKYLIKKSWGLLSNVNKLQKTIYRFRYGLFILRGLFLIRNNLYRCFGIFK